MIKCFAWLFWEFIRITENRMRRQMFRESRRFNSWYEYNAIKAISCDHCKERYQKGQSGMLRYYGKSDIKGDGGVKLC